MSTSLSTGKKPKTPRSEVESRDSPFLFVIDEHLDIHREQSPTKKLVKKPHAFQKKLPGAHVRAYQGSAVRHKPLSFDVRPYAAEAIQDHIKNVLEKVLGSIREARDREPAITQDALLLAVSTDLAATLPEPASSQSTAEGWEALLLKSLEYKTSLLQTAQFVSPAEAAKTLGVGNPAIRRRIRENKLFALTPPGQEDYRIPVWALGLAADNVRALMAASGDEPWTLYHFLVTPSGPLNGLRPFEVLLPADSLTSAQRGQREDLLRQLGLSNKSSLVSLVLDVLKAGLPAGDQVA